MPARLESRSAVTICSESSGAGGERVAGVRHVVAGERGEHGQSAATAIARPPSSSVAMSIGAAATGSM